MLAWRSLHLGPGNVTASIIHTSPLTSNPCFSEGTQTSLLAAQSAWLEAENTEVGELSPASMERKRVTSLALPAADLAMAVSLCERVGKVGRGGGLVKVEIAVRKHMCNILIHFLLLKRENKQSFNSPFTSSLTPSFIPYTCPSKFLIYEFNCSYDFLQVKYNLTCKRWPSAVCGMNTDLAWLLKIQTRLLMGKDG